MAKLGAMTLQEALRQPRWNVYILFILWLIIFWNALSFLVVALKSEGIRYEAIPILFRVAVFLNICILLAVSYEILQYCGVDIPVRRLRSIHGFVLIFVFCLPWVVSLVYARIVHWEFLRDEMIEAMQGNAEC